MRIDSRKLLKLFFSLMLYLSINEYLGPSFFLRHLNLATLANFWKSLNLSGAKIKISLFFSFFDLTGEWQKKIKHSTTKHRSILR